MASGTEPVRASTLRPGRDAAVSARGALEEREIELAALKIARQPHAQPAAHVEPQPRPRAGEFGQQLGQPVRGEIFRDAEPQHAVARRPRHHVARFLGQRKNAPRVGQKPLALLGRRRLLAVAMQELAAERLLEPSDLLTRAGEAPGVDDGDEAAQEIDVEHGRHHSYFHWI